jgi:transcriptional regulator with XRE-family HTH domain
MTEKNKLSLEQFTAKVGAQAPKFARALEEEDAYLQFCKKVREDLKQLREDMRIKQSEVAAELQMSQPGVSKIENGDGDIGLLTVCRYAGALGMQPTIAFAPAASTYLEHDRLKMTVRAIEKLTEARRAQADTSIHDRYNDLAALSATRSGGTSLPLAAIMGVLATAMSSAMAQSFSKEMASIVSTLTDIEADPDHTATVDTERSRRANVAAP